MILGVGLTGFLIFSACNKDNTPSLTNNGQKLVSKVWRLKAFTVPQVNNPSVDSSIMSPCSDSVLAAFDAYRNFQIANGAKQTCDSSKIPYDIGTWSFNAAEDSLILHGYKKNRVLKINKLNDTILIATYKDSLSPSNVLKKTITLK